MADLYLFTCPAGNGTAIANQAGLSADGRLVPHCPSGGTWTLVDSHSLSFNLASWLQEPANQQEFAGFFGAGFGLVAVSYAVGWGVRTLLSMIGR